MIRVFVENLLLFLLPTALYVSFALLVRRPESSAIAVINRAPILPLAVLGASLVAIVLSVFGNVGDGKPGQTYEPAVFQDGKVVPGRMR
ncbi:MAG: DUF6111 family protein [Hyphomicrobiaceae bacterium]